MGENMEEWIKKSDVLELLSLPSDILADYIYELKGVWVDEDWTNDKWIPCCERLPKDGEEVLITDSNEKVQKIMFNMWLYENPQYAHNIIPIAWQELPKPYKK